MKREVRLLGEHRLVSGRAHHCLLLVPVRHHEQFVGLRAEAFSCDILIELYVSMHWTLSQYFIAAESRNILQHEALFKLPLEHVDTGQCSRVSLQIKRDRLVLVLVLERAMS